MTNAHRSRRPMRCGSLATFAPLPLALLLLLLLLAGCGAQAGAWRLIGPTDGAHVYTLAADPTTPGLIYAGGDNGAVYRGLADQTGDVASGAGIPSGAAVASLLPDPMRAGVVLAGTSAGLYRTGDYGDHWRAYGAGLPSQATALALAATPDDATLLAGIDHGGIYRSVDDGAHWTRAGAGLPPQPTPVALAWDAPASLWLLGLTDATGPALYASADSGQNWAPRATGLPASAQVNALALLGDAPTPTLFAATTSGLFSSADSGQSWSHVGALPAGSALALATLRQQPTWLYAAVDSGVYRSMDGGAHWQVVAPGLTTNVQGLVATQGKTSGPVVYAAVGQVARYPTGIPSGGTDIPSWIVFGAILVILVGGGYVVSRRSRRFGYAMGAMRNEANTGRAAEETERWRREQQRLREQSAQSGQQRPPSGVASGPTPHSAESRRAGDDERSGGQRGQGRVLTPSDLTSRASTGAPANPTKAAQNGHGKPKQRT